MARAYTAWVLQKGKDDDAEYVGFDSTGNIKITKRIATAAQMSRRLDAKNLHRHLLARVVISTDYRARERVIG